MNIKSWIIKKWKAFWKWILLIITGGAILTASIVTPIPQHLQLKVSPEKILNSRVIKKEKCKKWKANGTSTCETIEYEDIVKYLYASDVEVSQEEGEDISKRTKNAKFFKGKLKDKKQEWTARTYVGEPFYEENDIWYQTKTATTTPDAFNTQVGFNSLFGQKVLADATTTYTGVGDGEVLTLLAATWDQVHDNNIGTGLSYTAVNGNTYSRSVSDGRHRIDRTFLPTDTSALPDDATISSALFYIWAIAKYDDGAAAYGYVTIIGETNQASETSLVVDDYEKCGAINNPTKGSDDIDITGITTGQYTTFTLNATGTGWIDKTGYSMFGLRNGFDIEDVNIGDSVNRISGIGLSYSEETGTSQDPYISITYTVPSAEAVSAQSPIKFE